MIESQLEIKRERRRETQKGWTCTQHEVTGADKDFRLLGCVTVQNGTHEHFGGSLCYHLQGRP